MSSRAIDGLHHVTALCGDPQRNFDFYSGVLGLRLVKKTVNFDDPSAYHLYYSDGLGTPGSVITFFPWKDMPNGRDGTGQVGATAFATREPALPYWEKRLDEKGVEYRGPMQRFNEVYIEFPDPDGLPLEIVVADQSKAFQPWSKAPVPADMQLCGFHSVTLSEAGYELTQALLSLQMGWKHVSQSGGRFRYRAPGAGPASLVDILCQPGARHGLPGSGTVHHVAFRVQDDEAQQMWRKTLVDRGHNVSPVMDRSYFHSIYYREPGGILFEIATNPPGFATDESTEAMGTGLMLPPQFEGMRRKIEQSLPPLNSAPA
jgi:catechol 2,3-dioxygenase-like lactoylglutathione lyase family enzyme